ncbi:MAG: CarD family transcriptional regulator [Chloroflexota bacterium]|nr:CarD family transcriptional regulator [Chloroflexota bacterium]
MTLNNTFTKGEWIVHPMYGIGRVQRTEKKVLSGKKAEYFRVETEESVFWVPVEEELNGRIRPLSSPSQLREALNSFKNPASNMASNYKQRRKRINEAIANNSLVIRCKLLRDLFAMQERKPLSMGEKQVFDLFQNLLLQEWSLCVDVPIKEIRCRYQQLLGKG